MGKMGFLMGSILDRVSLPPQASAPPSRSLEVNLHANCFHYIIVRYTSINGFPVGKRRYR